jgi:hypothetical protein
MRHAGGFVIKHTNNRNIRVNDETARRLINMNLNHNPTPNNFRISGINLNNNQRIGPIQVNLNGNGNNLGARLPNVTGQNANLNNQLTYINWLLSKIDVKCLSQETKQRFYDNDGTDGKPNLRQFLVMDDNKVIGFRINPNPVNINNINDQLKRLYLALPDLQFVHREKILNDSKLKLEIDKKRANYSRFNTPHDFTDNHNPQGQTLQNGGNIDQIVRKKYQNSISYAGINSFFNLSKKPEDPCLEFPDDLDALNGNYNNKSRQINRTIDGYCMKISRNNGTDWNDYENNQRSNFTKNFRDWLLEKIAPILKAKTPRQKQELEQKLKQRLYRIRGHNPGNGVPQALLNKENINYILKALGDHRLLLKSSIPNDLNIYHINNNELTDEIKEKNAKKCIMLMIQPIIDRAKIFSSSNSIKRRITDPESERINCLFKLYTQDLGSEEANIQELNDFFAKRLSKNPNQGGLVYDKQHNPDGIIEKYDVYQLNTNDGLTKITDRKNNCVPKDARPSIVKTSIKFRTPVTNPDYDENADNNDPNRHHHTLMIDRYHKNYKDHNYKDHKKNTYEIYLTNSQGRCVRPTVNNLTLGHFLDIARVISAKHEAADLTRLPAASAKIEIPLKNWGIINSRTRRRESYRKIPIQWIMHAALKAINPNIKIKTIPSSLEELRRTGQGGLVKRIETLTNYIRGIQPKGTAIPIMNSLST